MLFALHALYCSFCISILFFEVVHYDKNRSCTFTYGENNEYSVGIRDIDLEIEDGQVVVLVGRAVVEKQHSLE